MNEIESDFQHIADQVVNGLRLLDVDMSRVVTRFFALWSLRFRFRHNPAPDHPIPGVMPEKLSQNEEESL